MASPTKEIRKAVELPKANSDFYEFAETLHLDELTIFKKVRTFMEAKVAPIISKYWVEDTFPFELPPAFC
jgi:glutaryl-CoA dehydrogenase